MACVSEESAEIELVDEAISEPINCSEGSKWAPIVTIFEITLQSVKSTHEVDFLLNDLSNALFDWVRQAAVATDMERWAIQGHVSEVVIRAWQQELLETKIKELVDFLKILTLQMQVVHYRCHRSTELGGTPRHL